MTDRSGIMAAGAAVEDLFHEGLQLLYGAHRQGAAQAAANHDTSTSPKLRHMLRAGSEENLSQAQRLRKVFKAAGLVPNAKHDRAMQGIVDANNALVARTSDPAQRDLVNIALGQVAAHFYLARYGTLRTYAEALGYTQAARLLQKTLDETGRVDRSFTKLAEHLMARSGSRDYGGEGVLRATAAMHPAITTAALVGLAAAGAALFGSRSGKRVPSRT